jgi:hypothetical protein
MIEQGANASAYSKVKSENPYEDTREDCAQTLKSGRVVMSGEQYLTMADKMTIDDAQYVINNISGYHGSLNTQINSIFGGRPRIVQEYGERITKVKVNVHDAEFEEDMKHIYIHNIITLMQAKGMKFDKNLKIKFNLVKVDDDDEIDSDGRLEMDFEYYTCKDTKEEKK